MLTLHIVPVGAVNPAVLHWLSLSLQDSLGMTCLVQENGIDPSAAYSMTRRQYHSTRILANLSRLRLPGRGKVLGVGEVDLFIPILTFVYGEAQVSNRAAIVSTHRLRQSFYGLPEDTPLLYERCEKEAIHEIGHTFGLVHCSKYDCVMHFSNWIEQIDLKTNAFCSDCSRLLEERMRDA